jgi:LPXTG-site transpeptidase (sortase) family protein
MFFKIFEKIKNYSTKAVLFSGLFLAVFFGLFFLVNFDFNLSKNSSLPKNNGLTLNLGEEFTKRLGSTTFSMGNYTNWTKQNGLEDLNGNLDADPDNDGLPNYWEYVHGTDPLIADSDGDKFSDKQEIVNGYDPDALGDAKPFVKITIQKINIEAPMIWSKSEQEKEMLAELENGVGHYFKTASPGQSGNMIISGHSSNYVWARGKYNYIFKDLNKLEKDDIITLDVFQKNGRIISYRYKITEKFITNPDDERIFAESITPKLTLSTCWPLGTAFRRLIVKADIL